VLAFYRERARPKMPVVVIPERKPRDEDKAALLRREEAEKAAARREKRNARKRAARLRAKHGDPAAKLFLERRLATEAANRSWGRRERYRKEDLRDFLLRFSEDRKVPLRDILGETRTLPVARARHDLIAEIKTCFPALSTEAIGAVIQRDHTTVIYALQIAGLAPVEGKKAERIKRLRQAREAARAEALYLALKAQSEAA
jgi:chromosomal replication initiation ATPase DnaA